MVGCGTRVCRPVPLNTVRSCRCRESDLQAYERAKYSSLQGYADDILEIFDELKLEDAIFVGHSVSAVIGILAAIKQQELFDKLVLIGPSPRYINDNGYVGGFERNDIDELLEFQESDYLGWASSLGPAIMGNPNRPELGETLTNSFCRTDRRSQSSSRQSPSYQTIGLTCPN